MPRNRRDPEAGRDRKVLFQNLQRRWPWGYLDFRLSASRAARELSQLAAGFCYGSPRRPRHPPGIRGSPQPLRLLTANASLPPNSDCEKLRDDYLVCWIFTFSGSEISKPWPAGCIQCAAWFRLSVPHDCFTSRDEESQQRHCDPQDVYSLTITEKMCQALLWVIMSARLHF